MEEAVLDRLGAKSPEEAIIEQISRDFNLAPVMARTQFAQMRRYFERYMGLKRDYYQAQLEALRPPDLPDFEEIVELMADFPGTWKEETPEERKEILYTLLSEVRLDREKGGRDQGQSGDGNAFPTAASIIEAGVCLRPLLLKRYGLILDKRSV